MPRDPGLQPYFIVVLTVDHKLNIFTKQLFMYIEKYLLLKFVYMFLLPKFMYHY